MFAGRVTQINEHAVPYTVVITFEVTRAWKGVTGPSVSVRTAKSGTACGAWFLLGREYLVFSAFESEGEEAPPLLHTSACSGNNLVEDAQFDLWELGPSTPITDEDADHPSD